jgi:hypothetical protein
MRVKSLFELLATITYRDKPLVTLKAFAARHCVDPVTVSRWKAETRDLPSAVLTDLVAVLRAAGVKLTLVDVVGYERADAADFLAMLRREAKDKQKENTNGKSKPRRTRGEVRTT